MKTRVRPIIYAVLLGTLGLILVPKDTFSPRVSRNPAGAIERQEPKAPPGSESKDAGMRLALPQRVELGEPRGELFGSKSWAPPAPPVVEAPPPKPVAPPVPYRFAAAVRLDDGQLQIFLSKGNAIIPVREGDTIDDLYRVESVNNGEMTLVYLPLDSKQSIVLASSLLRPDAAIAKKRKQVPEPPKNLVRGQDGIWRYPAAGAPSPPPVSAPAAKLPATTSASELPAAASAGEPVTSRRALGRTGKRVRSAAPFAGDQNTSNQ